MHRQQLRKKAPRFHSPRSTLRASGLPQSYLKTRIRGSRLQKATRILALIELSCRLHQAYGQAYDKQAADRLLPQNPQPGFDQHLGEPPCPPDFLGIIAGGQAVTNAFNEAFNNAQKTQVEHGGWVVMNRKGGLRSVLKRREAVDHRTAVQLGYPEQHIRFRRGEIIVGTFHAHVDDVGPDEGDRGDVDINTNRDRVPGIVIRESQIQAYGPKRGFWRRDLPSGCQ